MEESFTDRCAADNFLKAISPRSEMNADLKARVDSLPRELIVELGRLMYRARCFRELDNWLNFVETKLLFQDHFGIQATCEILWRLNDEIFGETVKSQHLLKERLIVWEDYEPRPKDILTDKFFFTTFGSFDLEIAARAVVDLCTVVSGWIFHDHTAREWIPHGEHYLLEEAGWLRRDPRNRAIWRVTKGFVDRCAEAAKWRHRPDDTPTFMDRK